MAQSQERSSRGLARTISDILFSSWQQPNAVIRWVERVYWEDAVVVLTERNGRHSCFCPLLGTLRSINERYSKQQGASLLAEQKLPYLR
jgi:hypothetical protein